LHVKIAYTGTIIIVKISHPNGWEWSPLRIKIADLSNQNLKRKKKKKKPNQKNLLKKNKSKKGRSHGTNDW